MSSPTPPPPLPDPDDDLPIPAPRSRSRRRAASSDTRSAAPGTGPRPRSSQSVWAVLSPRAWAILIAVAAVVLVVIIGSVAGSGDEKKASTIETEGAATALQSLLDGVDEDTTLSACPFGSVTSIAEDVEDEVEVGGGELSDALRTIVIGGKDSVDQVLCSAATPDDRLHVVHTMYVYATPVPKDSYTDYLSKTLFAGAEAKLEEPEDFGGGRIHAYCITPGDDIRGGCGADWVAGDNKLVLGMQVVSNEVTAEQITAALKRELETLAKRLSGDEPNGSGVPDTSATTPDGTSGDTSPRGTVNDTEPSPTRPPATGSDGSTRGTVTASPPTSRSTSGSIGT